MLHFFVVVVTLFGWLVSYIRPLYIGILVSVLVSNIFLKYCFLSKWEYDLRRRANANIEYDFIYTSYYTHYLTKGYLSRDFLRWVGLGFTSVSLLIVIYFAYLY